MRGVSAALGRRLGRAHQAGSLGLRHPAVLREVIKRTQGTRFGPLVTPQTFELSAEATTLASGMREYEDGPAFFAHFGDLLRDVDLSGLELLDLGCGYGGRTVYYGQRCGARQVTGIEITEPVIERCRAFAANMETTNVDFRVGFGEALEFPDSSFDAVLSYDVLEHVRDPYRTLHEIARVLRPGCAAWLIFPTYLGARASHLDYLTQIPALHRIFDPDLLIEVVNEFLEAEPGRYGVNPQPPPVVGVFGEKALPSVNGMTRAQAITIAERTGLTIAHSQFAPMISSTTPIPLARPIGRMLEAVLATAAAPELIIGHIRLKLVKPG